MSREEVFFYTQCKIFTPHAITMRKVVETCWRHVVPARPSCTTLRHELWRRYVSALHERALLITFESQCSTTLLLFHRNLFNTCSSFSVMPPRRRIRSASYEWHAIMTWSYRYFVPASVVNWTSCSEPLAQVRMETTSVDRWIWDLGMRSTI